MPRYEVTLTEEVWHTIIVDAPTLSQATEKAWATLAKEGKDKFEQNDSEWSEYAHVEELEDIEAYPGLRDDGGTK